METTFTTQSLEVAALLYHQGHEPTTFAAVPQQPGKIKFGFERTAAFLQTLDRLTDERQPLPIPSMKALEPYRSALLRRGQAILGLRGVR